MKELFYNDYQKLQNQYTGGSLSEIKSVYYKLKMVKEELKISSVKLNGEEILICSSIQDFLPWVKEFFPNMLNYLKDDSIPEVFQENEFPKFKERRIEPEQLVGIILKRIKGLNIWGFKQKLKQNHQLVEGINFDDNILTVYLSDDAFLQIWNPKIIFESDYSLIIKNSTKIALAFVEKEIVEFFMNNGHLHVVSNLHGEIKNCKQISVLTEGIEIIK